MYLKTKSTYLWELLGRTTVVYLKTKEVSKRVTFHQEVPSTTSTTDSASNIQDTNNYAYRYVCIIILYRRQSIYSPDEQ